MKSVTFLLALLLELGSLAWTTQPHLSTPARAHSPIRAPGNSWYFVKQPGSRPPDLASSPAIEHSSLGTQSHQIPLVLHGTSEKNQGPGPLTWQPHTHLSTHPRAKTPIRAPWYFIKEPGSRSPQPDPEPGSLSAPR